MQRTTVWAVEIFFAGARRKLAVSFLPSQIGVGNQLDAGGSNCLARFGGGQNLDFRFSLAGQPASSGRDCVRAANVPFRW